MSVSSLAAFAFRMAPEFWRRVSKDMKREVEAAPRRPRIDAWPHMGLHAAWIGHSTVVISIDGFVVLTDPVFSNRIGIGLGPVGRGAGAQGQFACTDEVILADLIFDMHGSR